MNKQFWLYLEPYSFLFSNGEEFVIYNTLNSAYIRCACGKDHPITRRLVDELDNPDNGYCTTLDEKELQNSEVSQWAREIVESFSGNVVPSGIRKPFIMKPICRIYDSKSRMEKDDEFSFGRNILANLNEVSLYLPATGTDFPEEALPYYKQFLYGHPFAGNGMKSEDYMALLAKLSAARVGKVNLLNANYYADRDKITPCLAECSFKKCFYVRPSTSIHEMERLCVDDRTDFVIYLSARDDDAFIQKRCAELKDMPVDWHYIVASPEDLDRTEQIQEQLAVTLHITPYFNGHNLRFFRDYIFNRLEDIISDPIDKLCIFRRQTLNENFFGKFVIYPSGDVYANVNCARVGNVLHHTLGELVYKEMVTPTAWFMTRDRDACQNCVNKSLCPSVSNYELVTGIMNMCYANKEMHEPSE